MAGWKPAKLAGRDFKKYSIGSTVQNHNQKTTPKCTNRSLVDLGMVEQQPGDAPARKASGNSPIVTSISKDSILRWRTRRVKTFNWCRLET
nr:hypothetical protein [Tanacetum cinerariifolium]